MLKPIAPFIDYSINYDYISQVLCINKDKPVMKCNGKCYMMKKIEQQTNKGNPVLEIRMKDYPVAVVSFIPLKKEIFIQNRKKQVFFYKNKYSFLFEQEVFRPPTLVSLS